MLSIHRKPTKKTDGSQGTISSLQRRSTDSAVLPRVVLTKTQHIKRGAPACSRPRRQPQTLSQKLTNLLEDKPEISHSIASPRLVEAIKICNGSPKSGSLDPVSNSDEEKACDHIVQTSRENVPTPKYRPYRPESTSQTIPEREAAATYNQREINSRETSISSCEVKTQYPSSPPTNQYLPIPPSPIQPKATTAAARLPFPRMPASTISSPPPQSSFPNQPTSPLPSAPAPKILSPTSTTISPIRPTKANKSFPPTKYSNAEPPLHPLLRRLAAREAQTSYVEFLSLNTHTGTLILHLISSILTTLETTAQTTPLPLLQIRICALCTLTEAIRVGHLVRFLREGGEGEGEGNGEGQVLRAMEPELYGRILGILHLPRARGGRTVCKATVRGGRRGVEIRVEEVITRIDLIDLGREWRGRVNMDLRRRVKKEEGCGFI